MQYRSLSSSLNSVLHSLVPTSLLGPNILNTLFSYNLSLRSSLALSENASHPHKISRKKFEIYLILHGPQSAQHMTLGGAAFWTVCPFISYLTHFTNINIRSYFVDTDGVYWSTEKKTQCTKKLVSYLFEQLSVAKTLKDLTAERFVNFRIKFLVFLSWHNSSNWSRVSSLSTLHDHIQTHHTR